MPADMGPGGPRDPLRAIYERDQRRPTRSRLLAGAAAVLVLGAFAIVVYYAYHEGMRAGSGGVAPLIKAEQQPYKVKPEDPGGMEVPNQEKLIYNEVAPKSANAAGPAEHLLPPPETPMPKPEPTAPAQSTNAQTAETQAAAAPSSAAGQPATVAMPPQPAPGAPAANPAAPAHGNGLVAPPPPPMTGPVTESTQPAAPSSQASKAAAPQVAAKAPASAPSASSAAGPWRVQLGALRSNEEAQKEWSRLQKKHPDLLGSLTLNVQRVDLGSGKGVFFRVQGGPLSDKEAASALCGRLKAVQVSCLPVKS